MPTPGPSFHQVACYLCHGFIRRIVTQLDRYRFQRRPRDIAESDNGEIPEPPGMLAEQTNEKNLVTDSDHLATEFAHSREILATPVAVVLIYELIKWDRGDGAL